MNATPAPRSAEEFESRGFEVVEPVLEAGECRIARGHVDSIGLVAAGERNVLAEDWCRALAHRVRRYFGIARRLPQDAVVVQCSLFTKSPEQNWLVRRDATARPALRLWSAALAGWAQLAPCHLRPWVRSAARPPRSARGPD